MKTIQEYFKSVGKEDSSPITVSDFVALNDYYRAEHERESKEQQAQEDRINESLQPSSDATGDSSTATAQNERAPLALVEN
jgi:hypothetical protein